MLQHSSTAYTQLIATSLYATLASQWSWGIIVLQKNHKCHMLGGIVIKTDSSVHLKCLIGLKQANLMQKASGYFKTSCCNIIASEKPAGNKQKHHSTAKVALFG